MNLFDKPVIVIGHGVRASGVDPAPLLELGVPVLTSWPAIDTVDNFHPNYFGRPGIYGQRAANKILYEAQEVVALGCRLAPYMVGHAGLREGQKIHRILIEYGHEVGDFIRTFKPTVSCYSWLKACQQWRDKYPWVEYPAHDDTNGYVNSYQFIARLQAFLRPDEIIMVDNGCLMCPPMQVLRLKPPQRMLMAGNLGVMGATLPGAIGASFAFDKREILSLHGDGSLMMNVQELATVAYHNLPIKFIVFENDGYGMIKGTYDTLSKKRVGVDRKSGLGFPDFCKLANGFGIMARSMQTWDEFDECVPWLLNYDGPALLQLHIDPEQQFVPRLKPIIENGKITPARFDQLSPLL